MTNEQIWAELDKLPDRDETCTEAVYKQGSAGNPACAVCGYPISIVDQGDNGEPVYVHRWQEMSTEL